MCACLSLIRINDYPGKEPKTRSNRDLILDWGKIKRVHGQQLKFVPSIPGPIVIKIHLMLKMFATKLCVLNILINTVEWFFILIVHLCFSFSFSFRFGWDVTINVVVVVVILFFSVCLLETLKYNFQMMTSTDYNFLFDSFVAYLQ